MAASIRNDDGMTSRCAHCDRDIPSVNYDLHSLHCQRNMDRCLKCGEMVAKTRTEEHLEEFHFLTPCTLCGVEMERRLVTEHEEMECPSRLVHCAYCDLDKMAEAMAEHADVCGNRTDWCEACGKWVKLNERIAHDLRLHSSNYSPRPVEGENNHRDFPQETSPMSSVGPGRPRLSHDVIAAIAISIIGVSFLAYRLIRRGYVARRVSDGM